MVQPNGDPQLHANHTGICRNISYGVTKPKKAARYFLWSWSVAKSRSLLACLRVKCSLLSIHWSSNGASLVERPRIVWTHSAPSSVLGWMGGTACSSERKEVNTTNVGFQHLHTPWRIFHPLLLYIPSKFHRTLLLGSFELNHARCRIAQPTFFFKQLL